MSPNNAHTHHPSQPEGEPVPLAVWPTPAPPGPDVAVPLLPVLLVQRLLAVYTHPGDVVRAAGDPADVATITTTATALGRHPTGPGTTSRARLVVLTPGTPISSAELSGWTARLQPGGVLAVVLPHLIGPDTLLPGQVVAAADRAGLGYLQHVVAITAPLHHNHHIASPPEDPTEAEAAPGELAAGPVGVQVPVHTDVLIFDRTTDPEEVNP